MKTNPVSLFYIRLFRQSRGVAALEFALTLPLLVLFFMGVFEVTRYVLANQRMDNVSSNIVLFVSKQIGTEQFVSSNIDAIESTFSTLLGPYSDENAGFRISIIGANPDGSDIPLITSSEAGGNVSLTSRIGNVGEAVTIDALRGSVSSPDGTLTQNVVGRGDSIIAVEIEYQHSLVLSGISKIMDFFSDDAEPSTFLRGDETIYRRVFLRARGGLTTALTPPSVVPSSSRDEAVNTRPECCGYYCDSGGFNTTTGAPLNTEFRPPCFCLQGIADINGTTRAILPTNASRLVSLYPQFLSDPDILFANNNERFRWFYNPLYNDVVPRCGVVTPNYPDTSSNPPESTACTINALNALRNAFYRNNFNCPYRCETAVDYDRDGDLDGPNLRADGGLNPSCSCTNTCSGGSGPPNCVQSKSCSNPSGG